MSIVFDSFTDVVDETYDPANDGVQDIPDPHDQATLLSRVTGPLATFLPLMSSAEAQSATIVVPYRQVGEATKPSYYIYAVKRGYAKWKGGGRLKALEAKPLAVRMDWQPSFSDEVGSKTYTQTLHNRWAPHFDTYALELVRRSSQMSARDLKIAKQIGWLNALYNRRSVVSYSQVRPSQLGEATRITRADCSGSIAASCHWADILSVVDWRYTNTWVQISLGREVPGIADAKPGDVILYGSPSHEALYLGDGLVWSFGSYPIKILRHDYRHDRNSIRRFVPL